MGLFNRDKPSAAVKQRAELIYNMAVEARQRRRAAARAQGTGNRATSRNIDQLTPPDPEGGGGVALDMATVIELEDQTDMDAAELLQKMRRGVLRRQLRNPKDESTAYYVFVLGKDED